MRIEINACGDGSVAELQSSLSGLHKNINSTIESLRNVKSKMNNITGGVGTLSDAVSSLQARIRTEESKGHAVEELSRKTTAFVGNTVATDSQVASLVAVNQEKFYNTYTWLRPPAETEKSWWEKFADGWNDIWGDMGEALGGVVDGIVEFVKEHAVELIVGAVAIVVGAAVVALTGGAAAAFIPALLAGAKAAAISAFISGAIGSVLGLLAGENVLEAFGDGLVSGFMWGGLLAGISSAIAGVFRISARCGVTEKVFGKIKLWSPNSLNNPNAGGTIFKFGKTFRIDFEVNLVDFTKTQLFHTHIAKSAFEAMPAIFRGMSWVFSPARRDVHVRLIPVIAPFISTLDRKK